MKNLIPPVAIHRGQMYYAGLDPVQGSEQGGTRPVLVLQNDAGNHFSTTLIVAPITGRVKKMAQPTHVAIPPRFGLPYRSMAMLEQLRTIDRIRLGDYVGCVDGGLMARIDEALQISVGLKAVQADQLKEETTEAEELFLCLCPTCAQQFYDSPKHTIRRADPLQLEKSDCDYCQVRRGYDFRITIRKGGKSR